MSGPLTCIYQMPYSVLEGGDEPKMDLIDHVWSILCPLLTEEGKGKAGS